jgi:hypothetical protein
VGSATTGSDRLAHSVDAAHGAALSISSPRGGGDLASLRAVFDVGIDTLLKGIAARAEPRQR